jgi:hypothetical protein
MVEGSTYLVRVDNVVVPIESLVAIGVRVVTTADLIADTAAAAEGTRALVQASDVTCVRGELCVHGIGFPDIHLVAAGAIVIDVGYTIDPC